MRAVLTRLVLFVSAASTCSGTSTREELTVSTNATKADGASLAAEAEAEPPSPPVAPVRVPAEGSPARGADDAEVTITTFSDYACAASARLETQLWVLGSKYGRRVRFVAKERPLSSHPHARLAAEAALAAAAQGKFWEMHVTLMMHTGELDPAALRSHAAARGLDMDRFERDLVSAETRAKLAADLELASTLDVTATPTFFVNGRKVVGAKSLAELERLVAAAEKDSVAVAR